MNLRSSPLRAALHLGVVAAALALGLAVRAVLPAPSAAVTAGNAAAPQEGAPAFIPPVFHDAAAPLTGSAPAARESLKKRLTGLSRSADPLREQIELRALLLAGVADADDFRIAAELLEAAGSEIYFRQKMVEDMAQQLAATDPAGATAAALKLKDRQLRGRAISRAVETWAKRDPGAVLDFLRTQSASVKMNGLEAAFTELARRDPPAAFARAAEFDDPGFDYGLDRAILAVWAERDRAAAEAWVLSRPDPDDRRGKLLSLLDAAGQEDPESTWKLIQSLPAPDKPETQEMHRLLHLWAGKDSSAALAAVMSEPDAERSSALLAMLGRSMRLVDEGQGTDDRSRAMLDSLPGGPLRQEFLGGLAEGYINDGSRPDFRRAVELVGEVAEESRRNDLMGTLGERWGRADPPAASEWLNTLPPGPGRDAAVGEFVRGAFATDPAAALTWSAAIADEGKRSRRLAELFPQWKSRDPAAAAAWLSGQEHLTQADRSTLDGL